MSSGRTRLFWLFCAISFPIEYYCGWPLGTTATVVGGIGAGRNSGLAIGFFYGLLLDLTRGSTVGIHLVPLMVIGFSCGLLHGWLRLDRLLPLLLVGLAGALVQVIGSSIILSVVVTSNWPHPTYLPYLAAGVCVPVILHLGIRSKRPLDHCSSHTFL